jgi:spore coat polysaccharide biosynthesis protein SpsF
MDQPCSVEGLMRRTPVIIVQARMTSTRLPGKVMEPIEGRPMLAWQFDRLRRVRDDVRVAVATTVNQADDAIATLCEHEGVPVVRGSELDVLDRYRQAADALGADPVIRITSDCPLIDPDVSRQVLELWERKQPDYASNTLERTFPRGLDTEVFSHGALESAWQRADAPFEREHVTPYIYLRPEEYRLANLAAHADLGGLRWTVDTDEDLAFVRAVYQAIVPDTPAFTTRDVIELLERRPDIGRINATVEQKLLHE